MLLDTSNEVWPKLFKVAFSKPCRIEFRSDTQVFDVLDISVRISLKL